MSLDSASSATEIGRSLQLVASEFSNVRLRHDWIERAAVAKSSIRREDLGRLGPVSPLHISSAYLGLELLEPPRALLLENFSPRSRRGRVSRDDDQVSGRGTRGELDVSGGGTSDDVRTTQRHGGGGGDTRRRRGRHRRRRRSRSRDGRAAGAQHGRGHFLKREGAGDTPQREGKSWRRGDGASAGGREGDVD